MLRLEIEEGSMKEPLISGSQAQVTAKLANSISVRSERICAEHLGNEWGRLGLTVPGFGW